MKRGFTLIELLIVMVIVGILVVVALPQYKRTAERGRVTVGMAALRTAADKVNAWYLTHNSYPSTAKFDSAIKPNLGVAGVGTGESFSNITFGAKRVTVTRNTTSGWGYSLNATVDNGEITRIYCQSTTSANDCNYLGVDNVVEYNAGEEVKPKDKK